MEVRTLEILLRDLQQSVNSVQHIVGLIKVFEFPLIHSDKKSLAEWQREIHDLAVEKGWWPYADAVTTSVIVEKLCLIHSEVSEALEELRQGEGPHQFISYDEDTKPIGFVIELADIMIRTLDLCGALDLDIEEVIRVKHEYNKTRPHRHGGKAL